MPETEAVDMSGDPAPSRRPRLGPGSPRFEARLGRLDVWNTHWTRPDRRFLKAHLLYEALTGVILSALLCIPLILVLSGVWDWPLPWLLVSILVPAASVVITVVNLFLAPRRCRARGYAEREEDLLVRHGVMWHKVNAIPYGRLQFVEVSVGPIDRMFGLAKVELHTASSSTDAKILGISAEDAAQLREDLSQRGDDRLAGL